MHSFLYKNLTQGALFFVYKNVPPRLHQFQKFHEKLCDTKCHAICIFKNVTQFFWSNGQTKK